MGRQPYSNRLKTDECDQISVKFLKDHGFFKVDGRWAVLNWSRGGEIIGSINIEVWMTDGDEHIHFKSTDEKRGIDYKVRLKSTPCNFGGRRWWFICSAIKNNRVCRRRVGVLYMGSNKYFGCRHCYNLTYASQKESHKHDWLFKKMRIDAKVGRRLLLKK